MSNIAQCAIATSGDFTGKGGRGDNEFVNEFGNFRKLRKLLNSEILEKFGDSRIQLFRDTSTSMNSVRKH